MDIQDIQSIELEYLQLIDYQELKKAMILAYPSMPEAYWKESHIATLIERFPEGQVVLKINGQLAGCALSIRVMEATANKPHTYEEITGGYTFSTHQGHGDMLYGIDVFIQPEFRGLRLGRRLYDYRKELCEKLNLKGIVFGGRIPRYHHQAGQMTPKAYIEAVKRNTGQVTSRVNQRCHGTESVGHVVGEVESLQRLLGPLRIAGFDAIENQVVQRQISQATLAAALRVGAVTLRRVVSSKSLRPLGRQRLRNGGAHLLANAVDTLGVHTVELLRDIGFAGQGEYQLFETGCK